MSQFSDYTAAINARLTAIKSANPPVVDQEGFLVGQPNGRRYPDYFNVNLHFERRFRALHYLWAWRFGYNNITGSLNPNVVNNVQGSPTFLTYGRGQARAFSVRLRLLGRK